MGIQDDTADNSVGNVTGSNAVNVFLGIGIAWSMAAIYHWANGDYFKVSPGSLGFSVTIFCCEALLAIIVLLLRRNPAVGGELGGPKAVKTVTSSLFVIFWITYVGLQPWKHTVSSSRASKSYHTPTTTTHAMTIHAANCRFSINTSKNLVGI